MPLGCAQGTVKIAIAVVCANNAGDGEGAAGGTDARQVRVSRLIAIGAQIPQQIHGQRSHHENPIHLERGHDEGRSIAMDSMGARGQQQIRLLFQER